VVTAFALTMLLALGLMRMIAALRVGARTVPFVTTTVRLSGSDETVPPAPPMREGRAAGVPFVTSDRILVVRGPWRNAAAPGFAETVLRRSLRSNALAGFLEFLDEPSREVAVIFCAPYTPAKPGEEVGKRFLPKDGKRRGPLPDPDGPDRARLLVMCCELADGATLTDAVADKSKRRILRAAMAWADLSKPEDDDIVVKGPNTMGPPGRELPAEMTEDRWDFVMGQLAKRESLVSKPSETPTRPVATPAESTELILVQAPILRTRIQPEKMQYGNDAPKENLFALDIRDRLAASPTFRDRLKRFGAGTETVPVAFPRPGPNWYREHHVKYKLDGGGEWQAYGAEPQVSVFIMLVRTAPGADRQTLFSETQRGQRELLGAFIADLDFAIDPAADSVREITIIGPRRDLEERWTFFLSGL